MLGAEERACVGFAFKVAVLVLAVVVPMINELLPRACMNVVPAELGREVRIPARIALRVAEGGDVCCGGSVAHCEHVGERLQGFKVNVNQRALVVLVKDCERSVRTVPPLPVRPMHLSAFKYVEHLPTTRATERSRPPDVSKNSKGWLVAPRSTSRR
jgi:hypothetical protein